MIVHVLDEALAVRTVTVAGEHIINTRKKSPKTAVVLIYQPSVLTRTHLLMTKTYQNPRKTPQLSFPFCPTGMCGYWDAGLLAAVSGPAQGLLDWRLVVLGPRVVDMSNSAIFHKYSTG